MQTFHAITILATFSILILSCSGGSRKGASVGTFDDFSSLPKPSLIPFREGRWDKEKLVKKNYFGLAKADDPNSIVVTPQFSEILYAPEEGVYLAALEDEKPSEDKFKYTIHIYDKKGKEQTVLRSETSPIVWGHDEFRDGLVTYSRDGKDGAMDLLGKDVIVPQYDDLVLMGEGLAAAELGGKWTLISIGGGKAKELFAPKYSEIDFIISEGLIRVQEDKREGFINTKGEVVIPPQYEEVSSFSEGLAAVKIGNKYGYINKENKEVIRAQYDFADLFVNGFARVQRDGRWGYINKKGEEVVSPRYKEAGNFINGVAPVRLEDDWGCINEKGELFIPPQYKLIWRFPSINVIAVKKDNRWGFLDFKGNELVSPRYEDFNGFGENGLAVVKIGEKWGYVDKKGRVVISPKYDRAYPFMPCVELAVVYEDGKINYIDENGKPLLKEGLSASVAEIVDSKEVANILEEVEGGEGMLLERSHPFLMLPNLRQYYALKRYGSFFCFAGMDILTSGGTVIGFINPKGQIFWRDEKPPTPDIAGMWSGSGRMVRNCVSNWDFKLCGEDRVIPLDLLEIRGSGEKLSVKVSGNTYYKDLLTRYDLSTSYVIDLILLGGKEGKFIYQSSKESEDALRNLIKLLYFLHGVHRDEYPAWYPFITQVKTTKKAEMYLLTDKNGSKIEIIINAEGISGIQGSDPESKEEFRDSKATYYGEFSKEPPSP